MIEQIRALTAEEGALPFLGRVLRFRVYSRHTRAVNLSIDEPAALLAGKILPLLIKDYPLVPSGIVLESLDYFFHNDAGEIQITAQRLERLLLSPAAPGFLAAETHRVQELLACRQDPDDRLLKQHVREEHWDALFGLGSGLTPKGDDFLLGFSLFSRNRAFLETFERSDFRRKTTSLSAHFLEAAREKSYSRIILDFASGTNDSLLEYGESSGLYTAWGILCGLAGQNEN